MTSEGSAYTRFLRALDTGNLHLARTAALELRNVPLADAARLVALMLEDEQLYERAAMRWLARFLNDFPAAGLEQASEAVEALQAMPIDSEAATGRLVALCRVQPL